MLPTLFLLFLSFPFLLFGIRNLLLKKQGLVNTKQSKALVYIHFLGVLLCFITYAMSFYGWSFAGSKSTEIIFSITVFSGMLVYVLDTLQSKLAKVYFTTLTFVLGAFSAFHFYAFTIPSEDNVYYENENYRLQNLYKGFLGMPQAPDLFVKQGLFEKKYVLHGEYIPKDALDSLQIEETEKTYQVIFYHTDTSEYLKSLLVLETSK